MDERIARSRNEVAQTCKDCRTWIEIGCGESLILQTWSHLTRREEKKEGRSSCDLRSSILLEGQFTVKWSWQQWSPLCCALRRDIQWAVGAIAERFESLCLRFCIGRTQRSLNTTPTIPKWPLSFAEQSNHPRGPCFEKACRMSCHLITKRQIAEILVILPNLLNQESERCHKWWDWLLMIMTICCWRRSSHMQL